MPVITLERIPWPSLRVYLSVSVVLFAVTLYYSIQNEDTQESLQEILMQDSQINELLNTTSFIDVNNVQFANKFVNVLVYMLREPICLWVLVNTAYCMLVILANLIQRFIFGELRVSELQHLKDKFWNFIFHKFIFIFGVINVQYMEEIILWTSWFSFLGFLQLLCLLCKDRFEYLTFSPTTSKWNHVKLMSLLTIILMISDLMFIICAATGYAVGGVNTFAFMAAECILLFLRTLHVIIKYIIHLYDLNTENSNSNASENGDQSTRRTDRELWEKRNTTYYNDLIFELIILTIDLLHHLHMLLWSNIFLSMASLVICMQLRYLYNEIQRRIKKHKNYLTVINYMDKNYPIVRGEQLANTNCAICWEKMDSARKLPCSHYFHNACLQSWLEQDTSCPTCRLTLNMAVPRSTNQDTNENNLNNRQPPRNHFFHFDGSRYVSWLPSFSVEVTHSRLAPHQIINPRHLVELENMARQVTQLFPHISRQAILEDLQRTRTIELTIENILDGRLATSTMFQDVENNFNQTTNNNQTSNANEQTLNEHQTASSSYATENSETTRVVDKELQDEQSQDGRFLPSPKDRERMLNKRKEQTLMMARKRYLEKQEQNKKQNYQLNDKKKN